MNIHEYQAKDLLRRYDVPVPDGALAESAAEAKSAAAELGCAKWAVKAQVHAGGRGKAGGVKLVDTLEAVASTAGTLLGRPLVTEQTGPEGKVVRKVYIEPALEFSRGLYIGLLVDRASGRPAILGAREGGEDIEARAAAAPDVVRRLIVDPDAGLDQAALDGFLSELGLEGALGEQAAQLLSNLYRAFWELDASLIEINPLAVTDDDKLLALDVKISLDDNALFKHDDLEALRDQDEVDPSELEAKRYELNFVKLQGDIGVMVNGAGLALATIDLMLDEVELVALGLELAGVDLVLIAQSF
ncbi:MAG: ATP-grasp domain-containing protein, partial [Pseudomonadota bacterium]